MNESFHNSAESFELSKEIRFVSNRFLLSILGRVRKIKDENSAVQSNDRILDIGCGPESYFYSRWRDACARFPDSSPEMLVGIDKKKFPEDQARSQPPDFPTEYIVEDFFNYCIPEGGKRFNLIYSSFCQPWLLAVPEGQDSEQIDAAFFRKLDELLDPGGYFAVVSTDGVDNYPLYTRIILECLKRIGSPRTYEEYIREKTTSRNAYPHIRDSRELSIRETKKKWERWPGIADNQEQNQLFQNLIFLRTMEWIPLRCDTEFFEYWESGARDLLVGMLESEEKYEIFRGEFRKIVNSEQKLKQLNVRYHTDEHGSKYIFLPAHNYYQIVRKKCKGSALPLQCRHKRAIDSRDDKISLEKMLQLSEETACILNNRRLNRELSSRKIEERYKKEYFNTVLQIAPDEQDLIYTAIVQAGGEDTQGVELSYYGKRYEDRDKWVKKGRDLKLPTLTTGLLGSTTNKAHNQDSNCNNYAAMFTLIQEARCIGNCHPYLGCEHSPGNERFPVQVLLLPNGTLQKLRDELFEEIEDNGNASSTLFVCNEERKSILDPLLNICFSYPDKVRDWPRLLFASDEAENVLRQMVESDIGAVHGKEHEDWVNPLRYYIWQAYSSCPDPLGMVVVPRNIPGAKETSTSRTGFVGWNATGQTICEGFARARQLHPILSLLLSRSLVIEAEKAGEQQQLLKQMRVQSHELSETMALIGSAVPEYVRDCVRRSLFIFHGLETISKLPQDRLALYGMEYFGQGRTLEEIVKDAARLAAEHAVIASTAVDILIHIPHKEFEKEVKSYSENVYPEPELTTAHLPPPVFEQYEINRTRHLFETALVTAIKNSFKHVGKREKISVAYDAVRSAVTVRNPGTYSHNHGKLTSTEMTLQILADLYKGQCDASIVTEELDGVKVCTTRVPLPKGLLEESPIEDGNRE